MKLKTNRIYSLLMMIYIIVSIIELIKYFCFSSSLFGLFYMIINLVIILLMLILSFKYNETTKKSRIIIMIIMLMLGIFNSYLLNMIITKCVSYEVISSFASNIYLTKMIIKPIIFVLFIFITFIDIRAKMPEKPNVFGQKRLKKIKKIANK